jgi:tetratricopeptide (TPR) repeat protein
MMATDDAVPIRTDWQRAELLQQAWKLNDAFKSDSVVSLLSALPESELLEEPELGFVLARNLRRTGRRAQALALLQKLDVVLESQRHTRLARRCLYVEGALHYDAGRLTEARERWLRVLDEGLRHGDEYSVASAQNGLGTINSLLCQFPEALALFQRSLVVDFSVDRRGVLFDLCNIAGVYRDMRFPEEADNTFQRAMAIAESMGDFEIYAFAAIGRAELIARRGDTQMASEAATRVFELALRECEKINPTRHADMIYMQGEIARLDGRSTEARTFFERAREMAAESGVPWAEADSWCGLARVARDAGNAEEAARATEESVRLFESMGATRRAELAREGFTTGF